MIQMRLPGFQNQESSFSGSQAEHPSSNNMELNLSSHWNAHRHRDGEKMIEEILSLGLTRVELGYDLTADLVPGVLKMISSGAVSVDSVHNFCPVPMGAPMGHPELFDLSSPDTKIRGNAVDYTIRTIELAAQTGARAVVVHAGNIKMRNISRKLTDMCRKKQQFSDKYEKLKMQLLLDRDKKSLKYMDNLCQSLEKLMPALEAYKIQLGIEILPSWESIPTETEIQKILERFTSPLVAYWHDTGHSQLRQNLGLINQATWVKKLAPRLAGIHIHDLTDISKDHIMPPKGTIDFASVMKYLPPGAIRVLEPAPNTPANDIIDAVNFLRNIQPHADPLKPGASYKPGSF